MAYSKHPQPIARIIEIVKRFYAFERLHTVDLAEEYDVSAKTILRDFKKIASILPLTSHKGFYWLDTSELSQTQRLPSAMLQSFASNAGLSIECLKGSVSSIPVISFAIAYDGIAKGIAEEIIKSIEQGSKCTFMYVNNKGIRAKRTVSPIKLYTEKGKWYLLAKDDSSQSVRSFDFLKIEAFKVLTGTASELTKEDIDEANNRSSIWASSDMEPFEVKLYVSAYARRYLEEVPLHRSQSLLELHEDGPAVFTYTITHPMELLPEIKNWIPHIHLLSPESMRNDLRNDIESFLEKMDTMDI